MAKRKSKLAKVLEERNDKIYETTIPDCELWFNILNKELFDNELPPIDEIDIRWRRRSHAYYTYEENPDQYGFWCCLNMNKKYKSKLFFIEILAHEMVHHWQYCNGIDDVHGESFFSWKEKFLRKGLNLEKVY